MPKSRFLNVANMFLNAFHENKILAKISEFTVTTCMSIEMLLFSWVGQNIFG